MFDFNWSEIALIGVVALVFIGPKDMPTAIRGISNVLKKGRKLAAEFQTHVDDMVRDADLGEARETFRDLRSMNLRGQVMKALDNDGSLRRTLSDNPLSAVPSAAATSLPDAVPAETSVEARGEGRPVSGAEMLRRRNQPFGIAPLSETDPEPDREAEAEADGELAPAILPPRTARAMRRARRAAPPPAFIPPGQARPNNLYY